MLYRSWIYLPVTEIHMYIIYSIELTVLRLSWCQSSVSLCATNWHTARVGKGKAAAACQLKLSNASAAAAETAAATCNKQLQLQQRQLQRRLQTDVDRSSRIMCAKCNSKTKTAHDLKRWTSSKYPRLAWCLTCLVENDKN